MSHLNILLGVQPAIALLAYLIPFCTEPLESTSSRWKRLFLGLAFLILSTFTLTSTIYISQITLSSESYWQWLLAICIVALSGFLLRVGSGDAIIGWLLFIAPVGLVLAHTFSAAPFGMSFTAPHLAFMLILPRSIIHYYH